ncbi:MAG: DPP IV N-terminal domain-containing protein [Bacteroidota bacterium]
MRYFILLISFLLSLPVSAQNNRLNLLDAVSGRLFPKRLFQVQWKMEKDAFSYFQPGNPDLMLRKVNEDPEVLITLADFNDKTGLGLNRIPPHQWVQGDRLAFMPAGSVYVFDVDNQTIEKLFDLPEGASNLELSSSLNLAFTVDHNLYIGHALDGGVEKITEDGNREVVYGEAAHRQEFGISKGFFWNEQGDKLAFYRVDQRMVTDYPLINYQETPAAYTPIKYPMAGRASHHATVGIYDVIGHTTKYLQTGAPAEQYLTNITWRPNGEEIWLAIVNRDQNRTVLRAFDPKSGEVLTSLLDERHEKYVEPEHGPLFLGENKDEFIWQSERSGYNHLYLYTPDGSPPKALTEGPWEVSQVIGLDRASQRLWFTSTEQSPLERRIYVLNLKNGEKELITEDKGTHAASLSPTGKFLYHTLSSIEVPYQADLLEAKNGKLKADLFSAANPLEKYELGQMTLFPIKAEDGTSLFCRMIKPLDFDPAKKYPTVVYVYGGPHAQLVQDRWLGGASMFLYYLAQNGFLVFTMDSRGSAHRGLEFEQAIFRQVGTQEMADQLQGVNYLKGLPYVDESRMGVHGWSYGGFITTSLMLKHPEVFKVGVAGGPVIDWSLYEIMYTERYMDTPEQNPEGYAQANLLNYVENLQGDLLIIHGLQDNIVVPQHTRAFVRKCVEKGVLIDYFPYPTHPHNVRGLDRAHLLSKIYDYFKEKL